MATAQRAGRGRRARAAIRRVATRHPGIILLVLAGAALRWAVTAAYRPAFWYRADSEAYLSLSEHGLPVDQYRPLGYIVVLKALRPTGTLQSVAIGQHALGLAAAVAIYAFLQRRGLPRWLSCLAAAPLIFDSLQVTLEHFVLAETLFTTLLLAAILALVWQPTPGPPACVAAGLLLACAWLTKPIALPVAAVLLGYLLVRRVGRRRVAAFALAAFLPYLTVMAWIDGRPSPYGTNSTAIYGRTASFADCGRPGLDAVLTPAERELCPSPAQRGQRPDWYIWVAGAPGYPHRLGTAAYPQMRSFAAKVLATQPGDYLRVVAKETAAHLVPGVGLGPSYACLRERYSMPETARDATPPPSHCHPELALDGFGAWHADPTTNPAATDLTRALNDYSRTLRTSQIAVSAGLGLTLAALIPNRGRNRNRGRRRGQGQDRGQGQGQDRALVRDAAMLAAVILTLIIPTVLIGMHEARYALPALPLACAAAALAFRHLRLRRARRRRGRAWSAPPNRPPARA